MITQERYHVEKEIYMPLSEKADDPDVVLEFECDLNLERLKLLISKIADGHVMLETIAVAKDYTGERKYYPNPLWLNKWDALLKKTGTYTIK